MRSRQLRLLALGFRLSSVTKRTVILNRQPSRKPKAVFHPQFCGKACESVDCEFLYLLPTARHRCNFRATNPCKTLKKRLMRLMFKNPQGGSENVENCVQPFRFAHTEETVGLLLSLILGLLRWITGCLPRLSGRPGRPLAGCRPGRCASCAACLLSAFPAACACG